VEAYVALVWYSTRDGCGESWRHDELREKGPGSKEGCRFCGLIRGMSGLL
jgi:hypothetical protein